MSDRYEDERGVIQDLFDGLPVVVTKIHTLRGAVRGNHFHKKTIQWTLVTYGQLRMVSSDGEFLMRAREMCIHPPGVPHAWQALQDTECLVFTRGPRAGKNYESDTYRLEEPLLP